MTVKKKIRKTSYMTPNGMRGATNYVVFARVAKPPHAHPTFKDGPTYHQIVGALSVFQLQRKLVSNPTICEARGEASIDSAFGSEAERVRTVVADELGMSFSDPLLVISAEVGRKTSALKKEISGVSKLYGLKSAFYSTRQKKE